MLSAQIDSFIQHRWFAMCTFALQVERLKSPSRHLFTFPVSEINSRWRSGSFSTRTLCLLWWTFAPQWISIGWLLGDNYSRSISTLIGLISAAHYHSRPRGEPMIIAPPSILGTQVKHLCLWTDVHAVDKRLCWGICFFSSSDATSPKMTHVVHSCCDKRKVFCSVGHLPHMFIAKALIQRGECGDVLEVGRIGEGDVPHFLINADTNRKLILLCVRWGVRRWEGAEATSDEC